MIITTERVQHYFDLASQRDMDAYVAQFTADAVVGDEGQLHRGLDAIREWRTSVPRVIYTVLRVEETDNSSTAAVHIAGDFPGSPVQLDFDFRFEPDGRISALSTRA
jgi:hypothetical protein